MDYLPFKRQTHKMVKHTQTILRLLSTNCLSVFDHFVGLAFKGLMMKIDEGFLRTNFDGLETA